jgi:hypothetical protein
MCCCVFATWVVVFTSGFESCLFGVTLVLQFTMGQVEGQDVSSGHTACCVVLAVCCKGCCVLQQRS